MAIEKAIPTSIGPEATYHRIGTVRLNFEARVATAIVVSMWNKQAREDNLGAMGSNEYTLQGDNFPFTGDDVSHLKNLFGLADSQKLTAMEVTYDKTTAHCRVVASKTVRGVTGNWEEQHAIPKEEMPIDFLDVLYPKVQAALFPDATEV